VDYRIWHYAPGVLELNANAMRLLGAWWRVLDDLRRMHLQLPHRSKREMCLAAEVEKEMIGEV
jgi:hypothetical protein